MAPQPLLVNLSMLPEVVSAANAFMIFFTAAADLEHYSDLGVLQLYADTITVPPPATCPHRPPHLFS